MLCTFKCEGALCVPARLLPAQGTPEGLLVQAALAVEQWVLLAQGVLRLAQLLLLVLSVQVHRQVQVLPLMLTAVKPELSLLLGCAPVAVHAVLLKAR